MKIDEIPNKFPRCVYWIDAPRSHFEDHYIRDDGLDMNPAYQRWYVRTEAQKVAYMEYVYRGWKSGKTIYLNLPWLQWWKYPIEVVDWQQRLKTMLSFMKGEFTIFWDNYYKDMEHAREIESFRLEFMNYTDQKDVVNWYLAMNTWGTIHTEDDLKIALDYLATL